MKREENKSRCPINFTVEIIGDTWSLLIVRDMAALGKKTFGEFLDSKERIGTSVLTDRLAHLERKGIIAKRPDPSDKRKFVYSLTDKGIELIPVVYEIAMWGTRNSPDPDAPDVWFEALKRDREEVVRLWIEAVKAGSSFFNGPDSVIARLNL
ncbi:transcriptional regulator [Cohnella xylanilytica]|uniref:Helix-turn-helix transcriptional regulator n=1 Tax=Cohnella xylanilytica TaxID=557555 RepID=A0A841UBC0_9BACL|nr:helix-turn-helix domain-containing protein [Cohnella xylanilytica]MBB6695251.1 helix-turn-helix transcriptional regulator [Cohnella xylanilytica]GIO13143.1 transcriptional regulator [Cohnella xylanilytica]